MTNNPITLENIYEIAVSTQRTVASMQGTITTMQAAVADTQKMVIETKQDIGKLKTDIEKVKIDLETKIEDEVGDLAAMTAREFRKIDLRFDEVNKKSVLGGVKRVFRTA